MTINKKWLAALGFVAFLIFAGFGAGFGPRVFIRTASAQGSAAKYPTFQVDTSWPQLPNNWVFGNVSKIVVDKHDNVWLIHRPRDRKSVV